MVIKVSKILIKGNKIVNKSAFFPEIVFFFKKGVFFLQTQYEDCIIYSFVE